MAEKETTGLGERIRAIIQRSGLTQSYIAEQLGMSAPALSRLLRQGRNLKLPQVARIAELCGVGMEALVGAPGSTAREGLSAFRELVLLGMPPAVAYDLATGRGGLLTVEERERLNGLGERLQKAFRAGEGPGEVTSLFEAASEKLP